MAQQNTCANQKSWFNFDNQIEHYKQQIGQELYAIGGIVFSYYWSVSICWQQTPTASGQNKSAKT